MMNGTSMVVVNGVHYMDVCEILIDDGEITLRFIDSRLKEVKCPCKTQKVILNVATQSDINYGSTTIRNTHIFDNGYVYFMGYIGTCHTTGGCIAIGNVGSARAKFWEGKSDLYKLKGKALRNVRGFDYCGIKGRTRIISVYGNIQGIVNLSQNMYISMICDNFESSKCYIEALSCKRAFCYSARKLIVEDKLVMSGNGTWLNTQLEAF